MFRWGGIGSAQLVIWFRGRSSSGEQQKTLAQKEKIPPLCPLSSLSVPQESIKGNERQHKRAPVNPKRSAPRPCADRKRTHERAPAVCCACLHGRAGGGRRVEYPLRACVYCVMCAVDQFLIIIKQESANGPRRMLGGHSPRNSQGRPMNGPPWQQPSTIIRAPYTPTPLRRRFPISPYTPCSVQHVHRGGGEGVIDAPSRSVDSS